QTRREFPTRVTQWMQVFVQNRFISPVLSSPQRLPVPLGLRLLRSSPMLRRIFARLVGIGVRPEHAHTPEARITEDHGAQNMNRERDDAHLAAH
ncbi:MAG TPA: hypothetical protein VMT64_12230, partial [Candidatus Binataceae bacterium]|nr:hypothetical protein [Candidatus Binataceae bacterium]